VDAVVTLRVERRDSVEGAAGVVVVGGDGRVVGYQLRPNPAEALSDLVDVEDYDVEDEAYEYLPDGVPFGPEAIPLLLEQDVPVYAIGPGTTKPPGQA
jgi:mannose-1-phosphate guanylyltransferase/mannose-1-phosphate guanylyltransferase/phosphomannomutase